jgi:mannose-6-phosphate isomerase-like protein (cupin superfamily)
MSFPFPPRAPPLQKVPVGDERREEKMRRFLIAVTAAGAMLLAFASPTLAQTTVSIDADFHEQFEGAAPFKSCPTGGTDPCGVGRIKGFGKATERFVFESGEEVDSCFHYQGTTTMTLQDGSGTLVIAEEETECYPGNSSDAPGNLLHSFGNPASAEGTWVVLAGEGVFAGASGGGTLSYHAAGDALIIRYFGTVSLP